jgi:transposase-like protein
MIERSRGTIRQRNKVMRGLDEESKAQTMMDGFRIYYNFIRPHTALKGKTPAQKAKLIEQKGCLIKKASQHQRFQTNS